MNVLVKMVGCTLITHHRESVILAFMKVIRICKWKHYFICIKFFCCCFFSHMLSSGIVWVCVYIIYFLTCSFPCLYSWFTYRFFRYNLFNKTIPWTPSLVVAILCNADAELELLNKEIAWPFSIESEHSILCKLLNIVTEPVSLILKGMILLHQRP